MKCPSCNTKLTWQNLVKGHTTGNQYVCPSCQALSAPKHGLMFFIIVFLIGAPIIEFLMRLITESILHMAIGDVSVFGWELSRILSIAITITVMVIIYLKLNQLQLIKESGDRSLESSE